MVLKIGKKILQLGTLHASIALSMAVTAGTIVPKPDANVVDPEFGETVARSSSYTAVGAPQETVMFPGEPIPYGNSIGGQGVVYLFNGSSNTPERQYQFPDKPNYFKRAGAKLAISTKWLAFAALEGSPSSGNNPAIYIVGKINSQWPQCPTVRGILDCTSLVKANGTAGTQPILRINFAQHVDPTNIGLAISDNYLVVTNNTTSEVFIYRHDATQNRWVQEFYVDDLDERRLGTSVAIDGDKVAVSAPFTDGFEAGTVRIYKRNSAGVWNIGGAVYGHFTSGNFGRALDMNAGNLVVSAGRSGMDQHIVFFRVDANGGLSAQQESLTSTPARYVAIHGDTTIVSTMQQGRAINVFKRNTANNTWRETAALNAALYINPFNGNAIFGVADPIDLVGDDIVLGWRGYNSRRGAFIREKVSQIDECKSILNLVTNCSFDNNSGSGWQFLNHQGASASVNYNNGQINATINNPGSVHWHIQARTAVKTPEYGTYRVQFRAKSSTFRNITVNLGHNGAFDNNWVSYGQQSFVLNPDWTHYQYDFYGVPADANALLDFNLGNAGNAPVTIDGVSLTRFN